MRRAEWRSLPEDSAPRLRRAWRALRRRYRPVRKRPLPFKVFPPFRLWGFSWRRTLILGGFFAPMVLAAMMSLETLAIVLAAAALSFPLVFLMTRFRRVEAPPALVALLPDPGPGESFPVRLILRHCGRIVQEDAAAMFVEGWLHVEGLHTTFGLRACDVGTFVETRRGHVRLDLPEGQRVEFRAYEFRGMAFRQAFRIWHYYAIESPEGESRLPPLE